MTSDVKDISVTESNENESKPKSLTINQNSFEVESDINQTKMDSNQYIYGLESNAKKSYECRTNDSKTANF